MSGEMFSFVPRILYPDKDLFVPLLRRVIVRRKENLLFEVVELKQVDRPTRKRSTYERVNLQTKRVQYPGYKKEHSSTQ